MAVQSDTPSATEKHSAGASTRDRLLASAADLLAQNGSFDGVSLRAIAAGAGVSPTAVYRHFEDHADVLDSLASWCWRQFDEAVFGAGPDIADPCDRFLAQGQAYIAFAHEHPAVYRVLFEPRFDDVSRVADGAAVYEKLVEVVGEVLAANDDPRPPRRVAALVHTWIHGIATLKPNSAKGFPDSDEILLEMGVLLGLEPTTGQ